MEHKIAQRALDLHKALGGKLSVDSKTDIKTMDDLSVVYTPGVAAVCLEIAKDKNKAYEYTTKKNMIAVVTDGSAVLGLGNIGPEAAIPVMEGKCALFKTFANVDAVPISLATQETEAIISHIKAISPSFAGINLEDISAPRCFEIERRLIQELDIPVFHDDQHGTAIVVLAALYNALKLTQKQIDQIDIVINGAGAAGTAIAELLTAAGVQNIIMAGREGLICDGDTSLRPHYQTIAKVTNRGKRKGSLKEGLVGADVFIGVSSAGALKPEWISVMNEKPIIFALANPEPEILPDVALAAGAYVVGTGRSDFPNQINNVLAFPGIFRGVIDARAKVITVSMQIAAAKGIASTVSDAELKPDYILPDVFKPNLANIVAENVKAAIK